ncbi:hypothetical protein Tco_1364414 [Tanacetum coccineum]
MREPSETATRPTVPPQQHNPKDKAKLEEEERLAKQREEDANIAKWDKVQAMIDADYELAARLQEEEQGELTIKERSRLFMEVMDKRKKYFARLRAEDKTRAEGSSKRVGEDLQQESTKKQKVDDDDKEKEDLKQFFKIIPAEEVAINDIPLATKPAPIIDFWIHTKGKQGYYEIIRADGSSKIYLVFSQLLKEFDREDLENLWRLVKAKHWNTRPEEAYERVLWGDLKVMFEPDVESDCLEAI